MPCIRPCFFVHLFVRPSMFRSTFTCMSVSPIICLFVCLCISDRCSLVKRNTVFVMEAAFLRLFFDDGKPPRSNSCHRILSFFSAVEPVQNLFICFLQFIFSELRKKTSRERSGNLSYSLRKQRSPKEKFTLLETDTKTCRLTMQLISMVSWVSQLVTKLHRDIISDKQ